HDLTCISDSLVRRLDCLEEHVQVISAHPQITQDGNHLVLVEQDAERLLRVLHDQLMPLRCLLHLALTVKVGVHRTGGHNTRTEQCHCSDHISDLGRTQPPDVPGGGTTLDLEDPS